MTSRQRFFSLYIHIPYCSRKCPYCDFNTYAVSDVPEREYVDALIKELHWYQQSELFAGREIRSVFFGGGTPSILSATSLGRVIESANRAFPLEKPCEISIEANPMTAATEYFAALHHMGVNRVSLGAQTFSAHFLKVLGREHTPDVIKNAVSAVLAAGITNVSLDIMHGLPDQSTEDLERDLAAALSLPITHLSSYGLTIETGTPFYQRQQRGLLSIPCETEQVALLEALWRIMGDSGFVHYEISNFSKPGFQCAHNLGYWEGRDYLGIGAGAHSFCRAQNLEDAHDTDNVKAARWCNRAHPDDYMDRVDSGAAKAWEESLTRQDLEFEFFFLGLRKIEGVSLDRFVALFGSDRTYSYRMKAEELAKAGLLHIVGPQVSLTHRGMLLADTVISEFNLNE